MQPPPSACSDRPGQRGKEKQKLLHSGVPRRSSYGSTSEVVDSDVDVDDSCEVRLRSVPARIATEENMGDQGGRERNSAGVEPPKYRRLTARTAILPPEGKWYKLIHIPGITYRASPFSNVVHTTKYTILTFIPKNLWEQFHRVANIYFLFIALLNFVPQVEAFAKEIGFIPLAFILTVTAIKDIFEDYRRYRSDRDVNSRLCRVYDWETGIYVERQWQKVCVGDFVELPCDEAIPADILLLHTSDPHGLCYIETANIDGETNLKQRQIAPESVEQHEAPATGHFNPTGFTGELFCEQPHSKIYEFSGYVLHQDGRRIPVNRNNLLLRGCVLRNTTRVAGIVVYAGHQTKVLLNNSGPRAKRSKLERDINPDILALFIILALLCIAGAIGNGVWTGLHVDRNIVFFPFSSDVDSANPPLEGFIRFWTFLIILQVIVPISLYVSLEIVKFIQVYFINWDRDMYYAPTDRPFQCRALNINEDLGQIQYLFSDKTGTLTENLMIFRCCSIGGRSYPHTLKAELEKHGAIEDMATAKEETDYPTPPEEELQLDETLSDDLIDPTLVEAYIHDFFVVMAICNTVVVSRNGRCDLLTGVQGEGVEGGGGSEGEEGNSQTIVYEAESPDEAALVEAARSYGYTLVFRQPGRCTIQTPSVEKITYEVLHVLEFDPQRKCMSVIVREEGTSKVILYSKGADSAIYSNLAHHSGLLPQDYYKLFEEGAQTRADVTQLHLNAYGRLGLRTLCLARRVLSKEDYSSWLEERHAAEIALEDRETLLFNSACKIERDLELLGATGIEDRLQDGVPETIESLSIAGIKIWVLTGDKQETAVNIGYSSRLIDEEMDVIVVNATTLEECREILESRKQELDMQEEMLAQDQRSTHSTPSSTDSVTLVRKPCKAGDPGGYRGPPKALVIDGATLEFALDPTLEQLFLDIAKRCKSVICCRAAPAQKAAVVGLVKKKLQKLSLAVGDGANDVSMIQTADVGVGIAGREGMQAVIASDFAMARFRFLEKLLLVHGHWCYSRLARMMLYFFYKNLAYALIIFWFQLFNGFSGSNPIDGINLQIFNLVYTSVPILVVAVADQDLKAKTLLAGKCYYEQGRRSLLYTRWLFWLTLLDAVYQSAVVFFVAYGTYYTTDVGVTEFGFVINISIVITVSFHLAVEILHWTIAHHIVLWGSIIFTFVFNYVYTAIDTKQRFMDTYWLMQRTSARPQFWFVLLVTPMIALLPRIVAKVLEQEYFPSPVMRARVLEKKIARKEKKDRRTKIKVEVDAAVDSETATEDNFHPL